MKHAIYILFTYHFIVRTLTNYFDSDNLYYMLDALMIGVVGVFVCRQSVHSIRNVLALTGILILATCQVVNTFITMIGSSNHIIYLPELIALFIALDVGSIVIIRVYKQWSDGL